jgi:hypothetical protein
MLLFVAYTWPALSVVVYLPGSGPSAEEKALLPIEERLDKTNALFWNKQVFDENAYKSVLDDLYAIDWQALKQRVDASTAKYDRANKRYNSSVSRGIKLVDWLHEHTNDTIAISVAGFLNPPYKAAEEIMRELGWRQGNRVWLYRLRRHALESYVTALIKRGENEKAVAELCVYMKIYPEYVPVNDFLILSAHSHALENSLFRRGLENATADAPIGDAEYLQGRIREYEERLEEIPIDAYRPWSRFPARDM